MIVLDTNVVSELARPRTDPAVAAWLTLQPMASLAVTTLTLFELRFGLHLLPPSRRRGEIDAFLDEFCRMLTPSRILPLDADAAARAAAFCAGRRRTGRPVGVPDALIAGIALRHDAALATRNTRDFAGASLTLVDPWQTA